jgi:phage shock protein A
MGIFDRISRVIKGSANAALDKATDPAKELELLVREMEEQVPRARGETARSMAAVKQAERRIADLERQVEQWRTRGSSVPESEAELAAQVAERVTQLEAALAEAVRERREAAELAERQQAGLRTLEAKLRQVRARKGTIEAKLGLRKGLDARVEALGEFDRMAGRVDDEEGAIDAEAEVNAALDEPRDEPPPRPAPDDMDARLAALKKKLDK